MSSRRLSAKLMPMLDKGLDVPHRTPEALLLELDEAIMVNDTFTYAARLGVGVIGTTLSQPMPRMGQRLAEYEAARPTHGVTQPQRA